MASTRTRRSREEEMIEVKVVRTGGEVKYVEVAKDAFLSDALDAAGMDWTESTRVRVNGKSFFADDEEVELSEGDRIVISGKIKGGC